MKKQFAIAAATDRACELMLLLHRAGFDWCAEGVICDGHKIFPAAPIGEWVERGGETPQQVMNKVMAAWRFRMELLQIKDLLSS